MLVKSKSGNCELYCVVSKRGIGHFGYNYRYFQSTNKNFLHACASSILFEVYQLCLNEYFSIFLLIKVSAKCTNDRKMEAKFACKILIASSVPMK